MSYARPQTLEELEGYIRGEKQKIENLIAEGLGNDDRMVRQARTNIANLEENRARLEDRAEIQRLVDVQEEKGQDVIEQQKAEREANRAKISK